MSGKKPAFRKTLTIEWGDCDPANIVYFPRYFEYFDGCTTALFKHMGLAKPKLFERYGIIGIPVVDVKARFIAPSRFSNEVIVQSEIMGWRRSSFSIRHQLFNRRVLAVECHETRVWTAPSAGNRGRLESQPIPPEVLRKFAANLASNRKHHSLPRKKA